MQFFYIIFSICQVGDKGLCPPCREGASSHLITWPNFLLYDWKNMQRSRLYATNVILTIVCTYVRFLGVTQTTQQTASAIRLIIQTTTAMRATVITPSESTASLRALPTSTTTKCVISVGEVSSRLPVRLVKLFSDAASNQDIQLLIIILKHGAHGPWKMSTRANVMTISVPPATLSAA